jgi:hypothetical protein
MSDTEIVNTEVEDSGELDLLAFETKSTSDEGVWMPLRNPAILAEELKSRGKPVRIKLKGKDSASFRKTSRAASNRRLKTMQPGRGIKITAEENDMDSLALCVNCTIDWENIRVGGEEWPCTPENVKKFYEAFPAFMDQVDEFIGDRANFLKEAQKP